jgi:hypothetical protein
MTRRASAIRDFMTLRENNPWDARDITQIINLLGTFIYIVIQSCDVIWLFGSSALTALVLGSAL